MALSYVYILKCADETYYTGVTSNIEQRFQDHQRGLYVGSYTQKKTPCPIGLLSYFYGHYYRYRVREEN